MNRWFGIGAALAGLAVALGAFGAHGLKGRVGAENLEWWHTGANYHLGQAIAICVVALVGSRRVPAAGRIAGLFTAGIAIFSGSLYLMALTGVRILGAITPLGGICFISGWIWLAISAWQTPWKSDLDEKGP